MYIYICIYIDINIPIYILDLFAHIHIYTCKYICKSRRGEIVMYSLVIQDQIRKQWGERDIYSTCSIHLELYSKRK